MIRYKSYFEEAVIDPDKYLQNNIDPLLPSVQKIIHNSRNTWAICKKLNLIFRKYNISFKNLNQMSPNGILYGAAENNKKKSIIIFLSNNLINTRNSTAFKYFFIELKSKISHELIHRYQFIRMDNLKLNQMPTYKNEKEYLADKQEIMANAFNSIEYFRFMGIEDNQLKGFLKNKNPLLKSCVWYKKYLELFTNEDKELKLYYKYLYMYLDNQAQSI